MSRAIACFCGWTGYGMSGSLCPHGHGPTHWANDVCEIFTIKRHPNTLPCEAVRVHDVMSSIQNNPGGLPIWLRGLQYSGALTPRGTTLLLRDMNGWVEAEPFDWIVCMPESNTILWLKSSAAVDVAAGLMEGAP